jgi:hypothetical protein
MILQKTEHGQREQLQAIMGCTKLGIPWRMSKEFGNADECHVGSVEWCQEAMGFAPRPEFYPTWASRWLHRRISFSFGCAVNPAGRLFGKPWSGYKIAPARIFETGDYIPDGWVGSEVVNFVQEWRYYIADGELLAAGWYDGSNDDEPAPKLDIQWPSGWCGAADFGRLDTGEIALVECHHPYACGNYLEADECEAWVMWLEIGWASLRFLS